MTRPTAIVRQNVLYSVLDYICQPLIMLVAAPLLLRSLGVLQYGTWMLVNSITATASGLAGGFGDGATKYVAMYRTREDYHGATNSVLAILLVNCALGLAFAVTMAACGPWLITRVFPVPPALQHTAVVALRISAALLVVRFAEAVYTSATRGYERYRPMVQISVAARVATTIAAVLLARSSYGLVPILWATLFIAAVSLAGQAWLAHTMLQVRVSLSWCGISTALREVSSFSAFTWVKSTLGILVGHADRLLVGALLGTGPLAFYYLFNQVTQPMHALMASAFNFVFPNLSAQTASGHWLQAQRAYRTAARVATFSVLAIMATLIATSKMFLHLWLGAAAATEYRTLLISMAVGNGLLAISVVPHYAALALGRPRALAGINLVAGILSLGGGYLLIHRIGLLGAGFARIIAGVAFLWVFHVVRNAWSREIRDASTATAALPSAGLDFAR
jgi:O-antigen/teichoic acid export membrane protein